MVASTHPDVSVPGRKPEPWKRWLRQRPTNLWWIKGVLSWVKTSKKRIEGGSPQRTHGPGENCVLFTVPRICLFYLFFRIFAIAADCRYQVLFSKVLSNLGGFSFRMVLKCHCYCGSDRFVGEVKSDPGYPSNGLSPLAWDLGMDWPFVHESITESTDQHQNGLLKATFWKNTRLSAIFVLVYVTCWFSKKGGSPYSNRLLYDLKSPPSVTRNASRFLLYTVPKQLGASLHPTFQKLASAPFKEVFSNRNSVFCSPFAIQRFLFTTYLAWGKLTWQLKVGAFKMYLLSKNKFSIAMLVYWRAKKTSHQNISPKSPGSQPPLLQGWLYITNQLFFRGKSLHNYHTHLHEVSSPQLG